MTRPSDELVEVRDRRDLPFFQVRLAAVAAIRQAVYGPRRLRALGFSALLTQLANEQRHVGEHREVRAGYQTLAERGQISRATVKQMLDALAFAGVARCERVDDPERGATVTVVHLPVQEGAWTALTVAMVEHIALPRPGGHLLCQLGLIVVLLELCASQRSELGGRVLVAIPAIAVALFLVIEGGAVFALGMFALGTVCMHELYAMYERARPARLAGYIALAGLLAAALYGDQFQVLLAAVLALVLVFAMTMLQPQPSVGGLALTLLGIYWIGFALAHAVMLRGLPHGLGIVIDIAVGTFLGDTFAYLGGRMFGQRPLAPSISPNKTVEGLVIGMFFAVLGVWIAGRYQEWLPGTHALVLGLGVALVAPIGDLFESFVKREAGTKDSGGLFGAHGGALDRLDAVLFAAVVSYYIWAAYAH